MSIKINAKTIKTQSQLDTVIKFPRTDEEPF